MHTPKCSLKALRSENDLESVIKAATTPKQDMRKYDQRQFFLFPFPIYTCHYYPVVE